MVITSTHISLIRTSYLATPNFKWVRNCITIMCPQERARIFMNSHDDYHSIILKSMGLWPNFFSVISALIAFVIWNEITKWKKKRDKNVHKILNRKGCLQFKTPWGTSLADHWLRLWAPTTEGSSDPTTHMLWSKKKKTPLGNSKEIMNNLF